MEVCVDGFAQVIEYGSALLPTCCDDSPHAFGTTLSGFASGALGDFSVNDHKAYSLLREVVGRFHARCRDETEIGVAVLAETFRQVQSLLALPRCPGRGVVHVGAGVLEGPLKTLWGQGVSTVDDTEHLLLLGQSGEQIICTGDFAGQAPSSPQTLLHAIDTRREAAS